MIINIRYYVVMSASIFLALGVGIFIGFSLDGQEIFMEQQQGLISELEYRFMELKNENNQIEAEIKEREKELQLHRELTERLVPRLVEDTLNGFNIAILQSGSGYDLSGIEFMLNLAGAQVTSVTCLKGDAFDYSSQKAVLLRENLEELAERDELYPYISGRLVNAIITGGDREYVELVKELELIQVTGEYNGGVDFFILAGGNFDEGKEMAAASGITIIDAIKKCSIPVVGVEESGCEKSLVPHYKSAGISSVDNTDSIIGQYSLVRVLQGCVGHFGVKDTADALIPEHPGMR